MADVTIDLSEVAAVADTLATAPDQADKAIRLAGKTIGLQVKSRAIAEAPRPADGGPPFLSTQQGIRLRSWNFKGSSHVDIFTAEDTHGVNHGFYVEYGTSATPPRPFLSTQMGWAAPAYADAILAGCDPLKGTP